MSLDKFNKLETFYNLLYEGFEVNVDFNNELIFIHNNTNIDIVLSILSEKIKQLGYFKYFVFYSIENNIDFKLFICSNEDLKDEIEKDVEKHIDNGTFSWVLNNNKQIIINGPISKKQQLLIAISTKRRIHGMFIAISKDGSEISGIVQDVISLLISTAAQAIDNNELTKQLQNSNLELEEKITKRTAELEIAKEKAEHSAKSKLEFLANMSHEIRTPMNGVLGMLELLNKTSLDKTQQHQVDTAYQSGKNMMVILNDILELSKFEAGKITIEKTEFNLIETIEDVVELFSSTTNEQKVELICIIAADVPEVVYGPQTRVWQILMNLLGNAVKFTKSGSIVLTATIAEQVESDFNLCVKIKDTGIGISNDAIKLIFNPFEQAEENTASNFGGTGLGLALCQRLTELLGGDIRVESILNEGSTFDFSVKLKSIDSPVDTKFNEEEKLLYIEPSKLMGESVSAILNRLALSHTIVTNETMVLDEINSSSAKPYTIVMISDSVAKQCYQSLIDVFKSNKKYNNIKFILLSSSIETNETCYTHNITKPLRRSDIVHIISDDSSKEDNPVVKYKTHGGKVLLVEDNEVNQLVAKGMLSQMGVTLDIVNDGAEAVDAVSRNSYDLILMDINMPNMDGYKATEKIRESESDDSHVPIVALSANVMSDDIEKYYKVGMDDFLAKPFSFNKLEEILMKWLLGEEKHDQSEIFKSDSLEKLSTSYIDIDTLGGLKNILGENINELIVTFIDRSTLLVNEIMVNENDIEKIKFNIHSLKGSSGNIGAKELFRLCEMIENKISNKQIDKINSYLTILNHELSGVHKELSLFLKSK